MPTGRGVDKEDVVHTYDRILLSNKKEQSKAICSNMDGPRDDHTELSQYDNLWVIIFVERLHFLW